MPSAVGSFTLNSTGEQTAVSGLSFAPNMLIVFGMFATALDSFSGHASMSVVFVDPQGNMNTSGYYSRGGATTSISYRGRDNDEWRLLGENTWLTVIDGVTFTADGFKVNVSTAGSTRSFGYVALRVRNAEVFDLTSKGSTGAQAISLTGQWTPDLVFAAQSSEGGDSTLSAGGQLGFGWAYSTGADGELVCTIASQHNVTTSDTFRWHRTNAFLQRIDGGAGTETWRGSFVSFAAGTVNINWDLHGSGAKRWTGIAVETGGAVIGDVTYGHRTSTGTQSLTCTGVDPDVVLLGSVRGQTQDALVAGASLALGAGDGTNDVCAFTQDRDNVATTDADNRLDSNHAMTSINPTRSIQAEASVDSLGSETFDLQWDTATSGHDGWWLAIEANGPATPLTDGRGLAATTDGRGLTA
jgi:hypothetical protein